MSNILNLASLEESSSEKNDRWMVSYADMLTILLGMVLAIVSVNIKIQSEAKKETQVQSVMVKKSDMKINSIVKSLKNSFIFPYLSIKLLPNQVTLDLKDSLLFEEGDYHLKKEDSELILDELASVLKNSSLKVKVEGHTDNTPISRDVISNNWDLSALRATSVLKELESRGINSKVLSATGYGDTKPVTDNLTVESRALNRRISIVLYN